MSSAQPLPIARNTRAASNVFLIIGAHVIGMFGLIIVVGDLVDSSAHARARRRPAADGSLADQPALDHERSDSDGRALRPRPALRNFSYVSATAVSDSTAAHEHGKLLGFNHLVAASPAQASR